MSKIFSPGYAGAYDTLYKHKDYASECDLIERLVKSFGHEPVQRILDLGCGTGNHATILAQRGYEVAGVDVSESMIQEARRKASIDPGAKGVTYHHGDVRKFDLEQSFDVAIMMFAVLSYQLENNDVLSTLKTIHRHLGADGLLLCDFWYGPAVLCQKPGEKVKIAETPAGKLLRFSSGRLDSKNHLCTVDFNVWELAGKQVEAEIEEQHEVRYFFPRELELFLEVAGFELLRLGAFPDFDQEADETTWNAMIVARAV